MNLTAADGSGNSARQRIALRSQRDVSANVTIDQVSTRGVSLSSVIFEEYGYTSDALVQLYTLLDSGIHSVVADLYWNEGLRRFQLCPVPFDNILWQFENSTVRYFEEGTSSYQCEVGLGLEDLIYAVSEYLDESNTNLKADIMVMIFNIISIGSGRQYDASLQGSPNNTIANTASYFFGSKLFTPSLLENQDTLDSTSNNPNGYPTLQDFLFNQLHRVLTVTWKRSLPTNTTYNLSSDNGVVFNSSYFNSFTPLQNVYMDNVTERATVPWRFSFDSDEDEFTASSMNSVVLEGYSPILDHDSGNVNQTIALFNQSLWSWDVNEPKSPSVAKATDDSSDNSFSKDAYRCAVIGSDGLWRVANCYSDHRGACRGSNEFDWRTTRNVGSYFNMDDMCNNIEGDYTFSVPETSLQQKYLANYISSQNISATVWINMNSIAVEDCWITGGPYANCPYQRVQSKRNFARMIVPASVAAAFVIAMMLLMRFRKVPIQKNRKRWRHIEREKTEGEYDGVPS
ncbi:MTC6 [Cyberlindnera jadinii]|uniref:Maintenance of telomere capping protein 6 n=1 Tax=Cyberlindnera jadinii (strain ATCC 18201 / CBS 1600 / BCRC 20928 / JCM 3617 / NBRC 0987 / NRRL Y-1542) TaxID=983966 RepID=A0A0H5BZP9_CYBJN|nr:MTC6 [Cyberlindnera jadinii]